MYLGTHEILYHRSLHPLQLLTSQFLHLLSGGAHTFSVEVMGLVDEVTLQTCSRMLGAPVSARSTLECMVVLGALFQVIMLQV